MLYTNISMFTTYIGYIAGLLALTQLIPYLVSIFRGKTKPERATYAIWSTVNIVILLSYIASGATTTIWVAMAYTVSQLLVFGLSFKYGVGGFNKFDIACLLLAFVGIAIWVTTSDPSLALYFCILVKFIGLLPTLVKVYYKPGTESTTAWVMCASASTLNILALTSLAPQISSLPIYALLADGAIAFFVLFPKVRPKSVLVTRRKLARSS